MPLPQPDKDEKKGDFISRCAANPTMNKEYPKTDQRVAICYSIWREHEKKQRKGK